MWQRRKFSQSVVVGVSVGELDRNHTRARRQCDIVGLLRLRLLLSTFFIFYEIYLFDCLTVQRLELSQLDMFEKHVQHKHATATVSHQSPVYTTHTLPLSFNCLCGNSLPLQLVPVQQATRACARGGARRESPLSRFSIVQLHLRSFNCNNKLHFCFHNAIFPNSKM